MVALVLYCYAIRERVYEIGELGDRLESTVFAPDDDLGTGDVLVGALFGGEGLIPRPADAAGLEGGCPGQGLRQATTCSEGK